MFVALFATPAWPDDLGAFVEAQLREQGVPGASVVVIRANRVAWSGAFGVTNAITRQRVTVDTAFLVASNGKPVVGYLAARLLDLERPVLEQAAVDLPDTPAHRRITPAHILTHSSGLGNFLRDRRRALSFAPGEKFEYSGVGFMVLQELLERRSGKTLDALAREHVRMPHAWFGERPEGVTRIAVPHIPVLRALAPFTIVMAPLLFVVCIVLALLRRLTWRSAGIAFAVTGAAAFAFLLQRSGSWVLAAWFAALPSLVLLLLAILVRFVRRPLAGGVVLLAAIGALIAIRDLPIPLPTMEIGPANAASSLRATAPALAGFMIELSQPRTLDAAAVARMTRASRTIDARSAWGLGIGIEHHARGRDLWHWGSNPGAKSIMIICPETGDGVVVLTNGSEGSAAMRNIAARVMGREGCWRPGCD